MKKKTEELILILFYFKSRDYEAEFILSILTENPFPKRKACLYTKTRSVVMNTYKVKSNKEFLSSISYPMRRTIIT